MDILTKIFETVVDQYGIIGGGVLVVVGGFFWLMYKILKQFETQAESHRKERELATDKHYEKLELMEERHREERDRDQEALLKVIQQNSEENRNLVSALNGLESWLKGSLGGSR